MILQLQWTFTEQGELHLEERDREQQECLQPQLNSLLSWILCLCSSNSFLCCRPHPQSSDHYLVISKSICLKIYCLRLSAPGSHNFFTFVPIFWPYSLSYDALRLFAFLKISYIPHLCTSSNKRRSPGDIPQSRSVSTLGVASVGIAQQSPVLEYFLFSLLSRDSASECPEIPNSCTAEVVRHHCAT